MKNHYMVVLPPNRYLNIYFIYLFGSQIHLLFSRRHPKTQWHTDLHSKFKGQV